MLKLKLYFKDEIRKTSINKESTLNDLFQIIEQFTKIDKNTTQLIYLDNENEWINFSTSLEWDEAKSLKQETIKIKIERKENKNIEKKINEIKEVIQIEHYGFNCDSCYQKNIKGNRYHCLTCQNYDLCENCYFKELENHKHEFEKVQNSIIPNRNSCKYVSDITIKDGEEVICSSKINKIWEVKNIGNLSWPKGTYLEYLYGTDGFIEKETKQKEITLLNVNETGQISIELTAPQKPGYYKSFFQLMSKEGIPFGDRLFIEINAKEISLEDLNINEEKKKYQIQIEILTKMGYDNVDILVFLLKKNNGNIQKVYEEYKLYGF